jgi:L-malate glycosyltransferase
VRVLYFSDNSSDHNRRFLEKLSSHGHETWFLDVSGKDVDENWLPPGVRSVSHRKTVRRGSDPNAYELFLPEFQSLVAELQPDLLHAGPVQGCGYVAALSGFHPLLITSWGSDLLLDANCNEQWTKATKVALNRADGFFCDCDAVRTAAQGFAAIPDSRIAQFPWGIERRSFSSEGPVPPSLALDPKVVRIICTRSWEPLYGIDVLLEAFRQANGVDDRLRLLLLGEGSMADAVHSFISKAGLNELVMTPGRISRNDLPDWFRAANGYVSCALADGTSVSLLEAMATGLPVIATDIASNREWITEGQNGWLAAAGCPEDFAGKMLKLANLDPSEREAIRERNQKIVATRADWDKNFPILLDLYERMVKTRVVMHG